MTDIKIYSAHNIPNQNSSHVLEAEMYHTDTNDIWALWCLWRHDPACLQHEFITPQPVQFSNSYKWKNVLPGELASDAWNTEKLMRAYDARKKLEMIGAMTFNSAGEMKNKHISEWGEIIFDEENNLIS